MRLSLVSTAVLAACLATSSYAADLPVRAAPPVIYAPVFTWTGFYVGLNAGVGWSDSRDVVITGPTPGSSGILSGGGGDGVFVGGGQIGYNFQVGSIVYGVETDIQYVDVGGDVSWGAYSWWARGGNDGGYLGTVRARLGYAIDRTLIYITGGLAYGGLNSNPLTGNNTSNIGWTIGGGVEYAFTNNWTMKIEGLYIENGEGRKSRAFVNGPGGVLPAGLYTATTDGNGAGGILRVGVNYKF
ncbi:outer membrane beta-barrel protein [Bosea sp. BK604]|uniref:outer membrane protein n=1 Tax=Bosea sp. BK604 TaxID=2512180 RepID=UPI0010464FA5|nr:outer membrane beta-barrel protein [Bosea sp. BK604]TCR70572.1 outer membrane immunogenic protein [Bosea sp. BK604]